MSIQTNLSLFFLLTVLTAGTLQAEEGSPSQQVLMAKPLILADNRIIVRVIRVEFPPGFKTPRHIHEGPGPRYVLAGKIKIADKDGVRVYSPGEVFWETGEPMVAENAADTSAVLLIFEVAPQKPLMQGKVVIKPKEE
jgi:quercetin dioxygenase-like cupin family protein